MAREPRKERPVIGSPPSGSDGYAEIAVRFASDGGRVAACVETTRAGDADWQPFVLPLGREEIAGLASRALLEACLPGRGEEPARQLGQALFTALFHGPALERYSAARGPSRRAAPPLRLRFHLGSGSDVERRLHRLPWELLCEPGVGGGRLLGLDRRVSVVRHLAIPDGVPVLPRPDRLHVLVAAAEGRAPGVPPLDADGEIAAIRARCPTGGLVVVEVLRPATLDAMTERLREGRFHVLHLIGHGGLSGDEGVLLLPEKDGRLVPCRGEQLAALIGGLSPLRLVVINACRTAEAVAEQPFAGVATALLRHELPAAVAMQAPITDGAAARFAAAVYARLAAGDTADAAVAEGRLAIAHERPRTFEWAVPVLFSRLTGGELFTGPATPTARRRPNRYRSAAAASAVALVLLLASLLGPPATTSQPESVAESAVGDESATPPPAVPIAVGAFRLADFEISLADCGFLGPQVVCHLEIENHAPSNRALTVLGATQVHDTRGDDYRLQRARLGTRVRDLRGREQSVRFEVAGALEATLELTFSGISRRKRKLQLVDVHFAEGRCEFRDVTLTRD